MKRRQLKGIVLAAALIGTGVFTGCGGGSDRPQSYEAAVAEIESPTGTVSAETAQPVAQEFEAMASSGATGFAGSREDVRTTAQAQSASVPCDSGSADVNFSGDQNSGTASYTYNACCFGECCMDGVGDTFFNTSSTDYTTCYSYDMTVSCEGEASASMVFSGCLSAEGGIVYSVEVDDETYTVSGYYSEGSGELTIRGENGSYTCTYTDGTGSCVDETGDEFTF